VVRYYSLCVVEGVQRETEETAITNRKDSSWKERDGEREEGETSPPEEFISPGMAMEWEDRKRY